MKTTIIFLGLVVGILIPGFNLLSSAKAVTSLENESGIEISSFCRDRLMVLKSAYRLAELESQLGNFINSVVILEKGLRDASLKINPRFSNALTAKAIKRGIILLENLKATPNNRQKQRAINNFLFNYYIFIEDVSHRLDIPYFNSHLGPSRILNTNNQFERLFINFSKEQVNMVLKTMTTSTGNERSEVVYPIGSPDLLFSALKLTTLFMANDLSESIFAARYACTIEALNNVSLDISKYIARQSSYGDDFIAVQELVGATKRAIGGMSECHHGDGWENTNRTFDALKNPIRLESGTTEQIGLNGTPFIKKLIISAEGLRLDAMFDVVVNGDVKGTIFVPGKDPSYFVTVNDFSNSIELVSRGGTAIISRILVVVE